MSNRFIIIGVYFIFCFFVSGCAVKAVSPGRSKALSGQGVSGVIHHVRKGQTLWRISRAYGVDLEELVLANKIADKSKISIGQELIIPGAKREKEIAVPSIEDDVFIWPLKGKILSYFKQGYHHLINKGIDIAARPGAEVLSARAGVVSFCAENLKGYGGTIILDHRDGFITVYAYNSQNLVKPNQYVKKGEVIARVGQRPYNNISALHFQLRRGHRPRNPLYYLAPPEKRTDANYR